MTNGGLATTRGARRGEDDAVALRSPLSHSKMSNGQRGYGDPVDSAESDYEITGESCMNGGCSSRSVTEARKVKWSESSKTCSTLRWVLFFGLRGSLRNNGRSSNASICRSNHA